MKRAVAYARYSSDLQKDRSIDDQLAVCEQIARRHGYEIVATFTDRAKSGTGMFERDGLIALMQAAKKRSFDAVIVEQLDRLSRDQEDMAGIAKRLKFAEAVIVTSEGVVNDIVVGVRGIVSSMFVKDLADKVRRGMNGRVRDGKIPGKLAYGYRCVAGKPGEREIDPDKAGIVRRIFEEYAAGIPVRDIAASLARDKVPSPTGADAWAHQCFVGGGGNTRGIIGNELYVGRLRWNTHHSVKNPETEKRTRRKNGVDEVIVMEHPELRIVPQDLWDRAQAVVVERARVRFGNSGKPPVYHKTARDYLVAGLLICAACGGHMRIMRSVAHNTGQGARVGCVNARMRGARCQHAKTYDIGQIEQTILHGIKEKLVDRKALLELTRAYHERWAERQKESRTDREATQRQLNRVTVQIDRTVTAISDTADEPLQPLIAKLKTLEHERVGLAEKLRLIEAEGNIVDLHPKAIDQFARSMEEMHAALTSAGDVEQLALFRLAFRNVFERIVVHPTGKRKPYEVTPYARLSAIMGFEMFPKMRTTDEMLVETIGSASTLASISPAQ
jgi:DNA invertase Pin-like site-specific DNA recombinase